MRTPQQRVQGGGGGAGPGPGSSRRTEGGARRVLHACEQASAPAYAVVGPAVRKALTGTRKTHLALALGLRARYTTDGGPECGMPVSYRALPAEWDGRKPQEGEALFSGPYNIIAMVDIFDRPQPRGHLLGLLGSEGPVLTLLLRMCYTGQLLPSGLSSPQ